MGWRAVSCKAMGNRLELSEATLTSGLSEGFHLALISGVTGSPCGPRPVAMRAGERAVPRACQSIAGESAERAVDEVCSSRFWMVEGGYAETLPHRTQGLTTAGGREHEH